MESGNPLAQAKIVGRFLDDAHDPWSLVHAARSVAVDDAVERACGERLAGDLPFAVQAWIQREKIDAVVMAYSTVGPWKSIVDCLTGQVPMVFFVRSWDRALWPHAAARFFPMREKLSGFFQRTGKDK